MVSHIAADGTVREGTRVALDRNGFGDQWGVGPKGVAFGVGEIDEDAETSAITAVDSSGLRTRLARHDARASDRVLPFGQAGQIAVTLGSAKRHTSRVAVFDHDGKVASSPVLPMATAERTGDTGGCTVGFPRSPIVAETGAIFVYSELDDSIYGLESGPGRS